MNPSGVFFVELDLPLSAARTLLCSSFFYGVLRSFNRFSSVFCNSLSGFFYSFNRFLNFFNSGFNRAFCSFCCFFSGSFCFFYSRCFFSGCRASNGETEDESDDSEQFCELGHDAFPQMLKRTINETRPFVLTCEQLPRPSPREEHVSRFGLARQE